MRKVYGVIAVLVWTGLTFSACGSEGAAVRSMTDGTGEKIWLDAGSEEMTREYYMQEEAFLNAIEEALGAQGIRVQFCHLGNVAAYMTGEFEWNGRDYCATWQDGEIISWVEAQPLESEEECSF